MFSENDISRYFTAREFAQAKDMQEKMYVGELEIEEYESTGTIEINSWVDGGWYESNDVRVVIGRNGNLITHYCDCPYNYTHTTACKHVGAVLLEYIDEMRIAEIGNGYGQNMPVSVSSDPMITKLLDQYSLPASLQRSTKKVHLFPYINGIYDTNAIDVEFKIGYPGEHQYVIQSIDNFCHLIKTNDAKKYGKALEFVHSMDAFDASSKPLVKFLLSLYNKDNSFLEDTVRPYYYSFYSYNNTPTMKRNLQLKGVYLDLFFESIKDLAVYGAISDKYGQVTYALFQKFYNEPSLTTGVSTDEDGDLYFGGDSYCFAYTDRYYYFMNTNACCIYQFAFDPKYLPLYNFLQNARGSSMHISESDLPRFAKYIYPLVSTKTNFLNKAAFDPYDYTIEKPAFEIYLDLPQKNVITAEVKAIYKDAVYNIMDHTNSETRDMDEEAQMDAFVSPFFSSFNEEDKKLSLYDKDDNFYNFLTNSIPQLQEKASLFISDKLKRLKVKPMEKIKVGVSVSHDLLQLDLVSDEFSLKQIAEILSRYDRKKKYYRLKNGEFINMEDSDIDELIRLKDNLSLTSGDIENGTIRLPKFRAMYLDALGEDHAFDIEYDGSFRKMIQKMEQINQEDYKMPEGLNAELRPYQIEGIKWLCALRDNGLCGLLADEMGLGKTLQVIAMLGTWKERKRTLIVCPASLVYNWNSEVEKFLPSLPHRMIQGTAAQRRKLIQSSEEDEILITSYDLLKKDIDSYSELHFSCEVVDEAQYIKNATTQAAKAVKSIDSQFRVALTGTPIQNRLSELWSIFDYLMPGFFHSYETFRIRYEVPIVRDNDEFMEQELNQMITPFVLRRIKKDVLKDLPDKLEEVYYAPLEGQQKELYQAEVQKIKLLLEKQTDEEFKENKLVILSELTKLRQLCCNPGLLYEKYKGNSAKSDMTVDLIKNAIEAGHKILLFSQFTSMLAQLTDLLTKEGIKYYLLQGSTPKNVRAQMVEDFQNNDIPVFCISLKAGGTGLNLTAADIVIHYDPWWNTAAENQASDRAHRIGQKNIVTVYKLIIKDTIEERIIEMQKEKADLADRVLSGDGISEAKLTREDLLALL